MKKVLFIIVVIFAIALPVSYAEDAFDFLDAARCPHNTFSYENMQYIYITDEEFRNDQFAKFPPVYSPEGYVCYNRSADYSLVSEYDLTLIDQTSIDIDTIHGTDFGTEQGECTLDLYSAGEDCIIVAHDNKSIVCIQYVNSSKPAEITESTLTDCSIYFHYCRSRHAVNGHTYTLTAYFADGSMTVVTCDTNTGEVISVTDKSDTDSLILQFE